MRWAGTFQARCRARTCAPSARQPGGGRTRIEDLFAGRQRQLPEAQLSVRFGCVVVVVRSELGGELLKG
jgi:hypothetical protein